MTSKSEKFKALLDEFGAGVAALFDECEDPRAAREADKNRRHALHPREPYSVEFVKVYFDGDKDGNTFAVCHPTTKAIRPARNGRRGAKERVWKYTYENATGTSGERTWVGMLKTLDGHGRKATRVEFFGRSGMTHKVLG